MTRAEALDLNFGSDRWLEALPFAIMILGWLSVLSTSSDWVWKGAFCILLMLITGMLRRAAHCPDQSGAIRLFSDGTAFLRTADGDEFHALQRDHAWVSRWLCVVPLDRLDNGKRHTCLICATLNRPAEYRRLLQWLRMRVPVRTNGRFVW